ncbi:MAG TPA: UDP-N-acetylmuramate dehydrogenase [Methylomirabilota bacterium]|nr:UDP-N-acetylmuramate dehydrogenase [Methylomirabilota bacterium]
MLIPVEHAPLAPHCTLRLGGPARYLVEATDEVAVAEAVQWAAARRLPVRVLGGGSNLVIADEGVDGLVLRIALRGVTTREIPGAVEVTAAAGEPWDDFVRLTVERGWAGLECLSGIPGLVGATPIQNVGAYGQEVSDTLTAVRALDRESGRVVTLAPAACGFGYRDSLFKSGAPGRYVVLAATYRLIPGGPPYLGYADIAREVGSASPPLSTVRETVIRVRRSKSMVLDPGDPNVRSCGSFFLNPIVDAAALAAVEARAAGLSMPRWPQPDGRVKLSAAWLIERAGFTRGQAEGPVGLSTRHTLAIVCHDGARARDVVAFARRVRAGVEARFGVRLHPEPIFWGMIGID